jgi:hypothetical protein
MLETLSEPFKTILLPGTKANYDHYPDQSVFTPDTSNTGTYPGLLVYRDETAANGVELCAAAGEAFNYNTIGVVEIPKSHPSFPKQYDKSIAFTAATDYFQVHWLKVGDRVWLKGSTLTATYKTLLILAANGLVAVIADGTPAAVTIYSAHTFRCLVGVSSGTWVQAEYLGMMAVDNTND